MRTRPEILINSLLVTHDNFSNFYEFVINDDLQVMECVRIDSIVHGIITPIPNAAVALDGLLFELNHVRVNPREDNTYIIGCLTKALEEIGVKVFNPPTQNSMAICFKPLGEISENVRFYLNNQAKVIFLSPSAKPKLIKCK